MQYYFNPVHRISGFLSPVVKHLGYEADHSHISHTVGKNMWSYTSTLPYILMVLCVFKHRLFIFTRADLWTQSWTKGIKSVTPHHVCSIFSLIFSSYVFLDLPSDHFLSGVMTKILYIFFPAMCAICLAHPVFVLITITISNSLNLTSCHYFERLNEKLKILNFCSLELEFSFGFLWEQKRFLILSF